MGKFIGVIAATLDEREGVYVQTTELMDFPDEIWVYHCRPHLGAPLPCWRGCNRCRWKRCARSSSS